MAEVLPLLELTGVRDKEGRELPEVVAQDLKNYREALNDLSWPSYHLARTRARYLIDEHWERIMYLTDRD